MKFRVIQADGNTPKNKRNAVTDPIIFLSNAGDRCDLMMKRKLNKIGRKKKVSFVKYP